VYKKRDFSIFDILSVKAMGLKETRDWFISPEEELAAVYRRMEQTSPRH